MAEVDTSIYKPQPQQNPLDTITKITGAASGLGDLAVGQAMQSALKNDGTVDVNALSQLLKQSPVGAMKAVPTLDAVAKLRQAGFAADQSGLETFQKRMAITHHLFSGLASKEKPTMDDVYDIAAKVMDPALEAKKYGITLPVIMNAIKQFRGPDGKPLPPDKIKEKALEIQTQAAATSEILHQHSPRIEAHDRGGNIEFVPTGTGARPAVGTVLPKNLPPTTETASPTGSRLLGEQPAPPPAAVRPGASPETMPAPPVARGPMTSNPPGFSKGAEASAGVKAAALARAGTHAQDLYPLEQALTSLEKLGPGKVGPLSNEFNDIKSFLVANAPWVPGLDPESVKDYDEAKKYLTQAAQSRAGSFGGHTDQQLSTTLSSNPSTRISGLAAVDLTKAAIALRRMESAQALEADRQGISDANFTKWAAKWSTQQDARAYMVDKLNPEQYERLVKSLKPNERAKFNASLQTAIDNGLIHDPRTAR